MINKKQISDEIILKIVDTFHDSTMLYYNSLVDEEKDNTAVTNYNLKSEHSNYYECLMEVIDAYLDFKELNTDEETNAKIQNLFNELNDKLENYNLTNEEMRRALLFLDINGFKHLNFPLDYITPDVIGIICNYIVEHTVCKKEITLLDFNFGVGNLAFYLHNNLEKEVKLIGIENHSLLVNVSAHKADLMECELSMYHQDALEYVPSNIDVVVSDIATHDYENPNYTSKLYEQGVRYFPYLVIERYLDLDNDPIYIYIIDNSFFSQAGNDNFKELINEQGEIISLITLPLNLFTSEENAKSILVMQKKKSKKASSSVFALPEINNKDAFMNTMIDIIEHINKQRNQF